MSDDLITAEQAQALLDGATPGPWRVDGDPWNLIVWSFPDNRVCFMSHSNGLDDARDIATSELVAAAPDLARTVIAQAAELTRLRAQVDGLAEALADAAGALDSAGEELSDFANILSRDPWQANLAYESAVQARAALATYQKAQGGKE